MVIEYVSLDGVIQAPGHAGEDPEGGFAHGGRTDAFVADHRRYNSELARESLWVSVSSRERRGT
jgi:hypothetical protein